MTAKLRISYKLSEVARTTIRYTSLKEWVKATKWILLEPKWLRLLKLMTLAKHLLLWTKTKSSKNIWIWTCGASKMSDTRCKIVISNCPNDRIVKCIRIDSLVLWKLKRHRILTKSFNFQALKWASILLTRRRERSMYPFIRTICSETMNTKIFMERHNLRVWITKTSIDGSNRAVRRITIAKIWTKQA